MRVFVVRNGLCYNPCDMGFLERLVQESEERQTTRKEYEKWLKDNPGIKKEVDRLNEEAILAEQRAGVAAVIAVPMILASPLAALGFAVESGRQWHKGFRALGERNKVIQENSPHRKS